MPRKKVRITDISGGHSNTYLQRTETQYLTGVSVDPDFPINASSVTIPKTGGGITPVAYSKFSGTEFTGYPMWISAQPRTENSYIYSSDGKLHSFNNVLAMRTSDEAGTSFPITVTGGAGNGMVYYDNFMYLMEGTDVTQYGGLDQGASIAETENVWTGAKFGKAALNNSTYPAIRAVSIPNHPGHVHQDNALYFGDVIPSGFATAAYRGRGCLHKIKTSRTTIQGDTNDGSLYAALILPFGYMPTDIETAGNGTDLITSTVQTLTLQPLINQNKSALFIWDTFNDLPFREVDCPDPLITAIKNVNGTIYVFSGNVVAGCRVSVYEGGYGLRQIAFFPDGYSPYAGAVDAMSERVSFGAYTTYPTTTGSVISIGSKSGTYPGVLHNTAASTSSGDNPIVTSLCYVQQSVYQRPQVVIGWGDDSAKGLDKYSTTGTLKSVFRQMFNVGASFNVERVKIALNEAVTSTTNIVVKVYTDNEITSYTLGTINNTNFPSEKVVTFKPEASNVPVGNLNFIVELTWSNTRPTGVNYIDVFYQEIDDDKAI